MSPEPMTGPEAPLDEERVEYRVRLPVFNGPLDLLLDLIERREMDITKVSLAEVADQFVEHLSSLDRLDPGYLADFLVVAAKLLWIKSQALLPRPPSAEEDEEEEDMGELLARQLREYKRFKEAALVLRQREEAGSYCYVRTAPPPHFERHLKPGEVSVADLGQALRRLLATSPDVPATPVSIRAAVISLSEKIEELESRVLRRGQVTFEELFDPSTSRPEVIVTFLALLELIKRGRVRARQERLFGEILILARREEGTDRDDGLASSEPLIAAGG